MHDHEHHDEHILDRLLRIDGVAWCVHPMEHELSVFYDITHSQGLAILPPTGWNSPCGTRPWNG